MTLDLTNETLLQAMFESKLSYTSNPRAPNGKLWPLPDLKYRVKSASDITDIKFNEGDTLVMTHDDDYIPEEGRRRRHDGGIPFEPFQLYNVNVSNGSITITEVSRCFWRNGGFSIHGRLSENLGYFFYKMIRKIAQRANWRGYTYRDQFEDLALEYLVRYALKFNHSHNKQNPIGYCNMLIENAFKREVQKQRRHHHYSDATTTQHLGQVIENCYW